MDLKRIIYLAFLVCLVGHVHAQIAFDTYDINQSIGKARIQIETGNYQYHKPESENYYKFGYGIGGESLIPWKDRSKFSLGFGVLYNGVYEEMKTYSVENASYYYRSTTLTGRLVANTAAMYKYNLARQVQVGVGFQVNIVLNEFKDQIILGESISAIPDISFQRTEMSLLASIGYVVDPNWMVNLVGQYAVSPLTQGENPSYMRGIRLQLSRRIR